MIGRVTAIDTTTSTNFFWKIPRNRTSMLKTARTNKKKTKKMTVSYLLFHTPDVVIHKISCRRSWLLLHVVLTVKMPQQGFSQCSPVRNSGEGVNWVCCLRELGPLRSILTNWSHPPNSPIRSQTRSIAGAVQYCTVLYYVVLVLVRFSKEQYSTVQYSCFHREAEPEDSDQQRRHFFLVLSSYFSSLHFISIQPFSVPILFYPCISVTKTL
jgi:hypothetical protein